MPPLRTLRRNRGFSQKELARRARLAEHTIASTEARRTVPHPENQRAIARVLGVRILEIDEFVRERE